MEKAFDRVDWDFVEEVLKLKASDAKWIKWILGLSSLIDFISSQGAFEGFTVGKDKVNVSLL